MPRNSSGAYSLPAGNPVISNTLIETNWANPTMADIGQALTESLDRYGRGGMLAPFRLFDGTVTAPALSFASETSTGIYRTTAGTWNLSILGVNVFGATATGVTIVPPTTFQGTATFNSPALRAADPATGNELTRKTYVDNAINTATGGGLTYVKRAGDSMTGQLSITTALESKLTLRSPAATNSAAINFGRVATEGYLGVAGGPNSFTTGDVAGDMTLRSEQRIFLSIGAAAYAIASPALGFVSNTRFSAIGPIGVPIGSGLQLGTASAQPIMQMSMLGGGVDSKHWDQYAGPSQMTFRILNDALNAAQNWMEVNRTGMVINNIGLPSGSLWVGSNLTGTKHKAAINGALNLPQATSTLLSGIVGSGNSDDIFTYDGKILSNYGLAWAMHSTQAAGPSALFTSYGDIRFISSWADAMIIRGGLVGVGGRVPVTHALEVRGTIASGYSTAEGLRVVNNQAYIAFMDNANSVRSGYIQYTAGGSALFSAETSTNFTFAVPGNSGALVINSAGVYNGPGAPSRLVRIGEFPVSSTSGGTPTVGWRYGRVAATVGVIGSVTFSASFTTVYACVAMVEGAQGGGWIFRYHSVTTTGFNWVWDNFNTVGSGNACFINYWVIGV
jgi:hypothetical protein